jgi:hypothetical protein
MDTWSIVSIIENIIFWLLVFYVAWNENRTPEWAYVLLLVYLVYFGVKTILQKQGMDRAVWLYSLNMIVIVYLMYRLIHK